MHSQIYINLCKYKCVIFRQKREKDFLKPLFPYVVVQEGEAFTKTSCYHYFHCHCLGRYASHSESELRQREKELEEDKTRSRMDCQV